MDKMLNSIWFIRILAFFIALMLFIMVSQNNMGSHSILPEVPTGNYLIEDEPLTVLYDEERFELVDQQEAVNVQLQGSQVSISLFQIASNRSTEVFVDATEIDTAGEHMLAVNTRNFPSDLSVTVQPQVVRIELEERQTASYPVLVELENAEAVSDEQSVGSAIVAPLNVEVTANRETIEAIEEVKVFVDLTDATETIEEDFPVHFYDETGQKMDVQAEPNFVSVTVPITSPNKLVPVKMMRENQMPDGLSIDDVTISPNDVTVYGSKADLETIEFVESEPIDLSEIEDSGETTVSLMVPDGAERIDPDEVTVTFTVGDEEEVVLDSVPIEMVGRESGVAFADGAPRSVSVRAFGSESRLDGLMVEDLSVQVDASGSYDGEQVLPLSVTGPSHIRFELEEEETTLRFTE
ncbi:YbbR domain-containing protein [Alkalihalobacillus xiaoxiensis]|uniref:YbbR domain-containing protein n=1 Tax=Shouchella xiaoxiensis TaxID=766895 RepID=A0ABS2SV42_9BACI|nr:CdaR family protein [Shouchella xiaoxiensis]MBM7839339.1 YbbR domain-containing protein [Shouchella xiaoxiensis]